jgi:hypothetical protein
MPRVRLTRRLVAALVIGAIAGCGGATLPIDDEIDPSSTISSGDGGAHDATGGDARGDAGDSSVPTDATAHPDARVEGGRADASTCGVCDGTCFGARCLIVLASQQVNPESLAVTSRGVYWMNSGTPDTQYSESAVMWVGLDGGASSLIARTPGGSANEVIADDALIVWTHDGAIESVPADLHAAPGTLGANGFHIAMDDAGIYWNGYPQNSGITTAVWRADRDGANQRELMRAPGIPAPILVSNGVVYWQSYGSNYTTTFYAVAALGGAQQTLASGFGSGEFPWAILAGGIYWADTALPLEIHRTDLDGGSTAVVASQFTVGAMTADDHAIYFTNENSLYAMSVDGGAPVALAWRFASPYAVAVDANSVYFADIGECDGGACSGAIYKLTPK